MIHRFLCLFVCLVDCLFVSLPYIGVIVQLCSVVPWLFHQQFPLPTPAHRQNDSRPVLLRGAHLFLVLGVFRFRTTLLALEAREVDVVATRQAVCFSVRESTQDARLCRRTHVDREARAVVLL